MDTTQFHAWYTVVMLVIFVGIFAWAYSARRKGEFHEAANLPFVGDAPEDSAERPTRGAEGNGDTDKESAQ